MRGSVEGSARYSPEQRRALIEGIVCAFCGAVCWGFSGTCANFLFDNFGLNPSWVVCWRLIVAGLIFLGISLATQREQLVGLLRDGRMMARTVLVALMGVLLIQMSYMLSIKYCGADTALLLQQVGLLFIMGISCIRVRRLPNKREFLCLVMAIVGVWLIATQGNPTVLSINPRGLFWGIVAAMALTAHNLLPIPVMRKYGNIVMNAVSFLIAAIVLVPIERPWETHVEMPADGWLALVAIIVLGTFLAYFLYMQGVRKAGPVRASLIAVMEPASAQVFCFVWLGMVPTCWDLIGCALILGMVVLISLPAKGSAAPKE